MLVRSKFCLQFVEKMEKLKLSLSKQHSKMLKIKSEMLKIRKNVKIIKLEKISRKNFREFFEFREFQRFAGLLPKIFGISSKDPEDFRNSGNFPKSQRNFLKISRFPGSWKSEKKGNAISLAVSRTLCRSANGPVLLLFSGIGPLTSRKTIIGNPLNLFILNDTLKRFNFAN